jgi:alkanesulfonate monooxygenase SsuD/methylene tetrahydromethanopterin reductase-like flavin-dependent oxidoreductase (luciferase family)
MRLGYSVTSFYPPDVHHYEAATELVSRAQVASDAGYDYVEAGDHHAVSGGNYLQNVPTSGRLAGVFDHVATMYLLPLYDPVLVAEQAGTLDALAAEFDLWCAVGDADQARAMGVDPADRVGRFVEALALLERLWDHDDVDFDGDHFQVEGLSVNPKSNARICVGASARTAVERAGYRGDAWVAGPAEPVAALPEKIGWFEQGREARGKDPDWDVIVRREALVLDDGDRARDLVDEKLQSGYRGWPADAEWVLAGSPDEVVADLERLDEQGADEVVVRPMSDSHAIETLRGVARAHTNL